MSSVCPSRGWSPHPITSTRPVHCATVLNLLMRVINQKKKENKSNIRKLLNKKFTWAVTEVFGISDCAGGWSITERSIVDGYYFPYHLSLLVSGKNAISDEWEMRRLKMYIIWGQRYRVIDNCDEVERSRSFVRDRIGTYRYVRFESEFVEMTCVLLILPGPDIQLYSWLLAASIDSHGKKPW